MGFLTAILLLVQVDQKEVDRSIEKGIAFLKARIGPKQLVDYKDSSVELICWTLIHSGVAEDDPDFQKVLKAVLKSGLTQTYRVSLRAMILEQVDRVKYRHELYKCAQFLVDNQAKNGQWSYGSKTTYDPPPRTVATGGVEKPLSIPVIRKPKPNVGKKIKLKKQKDGPPKGDNSNSQYALLGLRACHDAGMVIPRDVVKKSDEWWRKSQRKAKDAQPRRVGTGGSGKPRGWVYNEDHPEWKPWGSMSAGAVGSLVICQYLQRKQWKRDKDVRDGMAWLEANFTVSENHNLPEKQKVAMGQSMALYYLYALERACALYDPKLKKLGDHDWYQEGADYLLSKQEVDGSWSSESGKHEIWDTCFAILFLRKATAPLKVATGGIRK